MSHPPVSDDLVEAVAEHIGIVAQPPIEGVLAVAAVEDVVAVAAIEGVVAAHPVEDVVAVEAIEGVLAQLPVSTLANSLPVPLTLAEKVSVRFSMPE